MNLLHSTYFFPIFDVHTDNFWWYGSPMSNGQILDLLAQSVVKGTIVEWKMRIFAQRCMEDKQAKTSSY